MEVPCTLEQFFEVFRNYNETVFPVQVILYLLSVTVIYLTIKRTAKSDKIISGILAFLWLWMGVVYHLVFFTTINKAAYLFGAIFILQGILFLTLGIIKAKLSFKLILFALIIYPFLGHFLGHAYPASPTFGLPCPTTIFTFGLLLLTDKNCPVAIIIIPFVWSIVGFTAAFNFGVWEDTGLLIAGLITLFMLLIKKRIPSAKQSGRI